MSDTLTSGNVPMGTRSVTTEREESAVPPRVRAVSIVDVVVDELRQEIFRGDLPGGEVLTEAEVSARYDVARPTARAAIERLVADGLLVRAQHKSARVPVIGPDDVRDIYETRRRIESEALRTLAATSHVPTGAREANEELKRSAAADALAIVEPDMRLHASLVDAVGSPRLTRVYGSLVGEVRLCMSQVQGKSLLSAELIAREHDEILALLERGDAAGAVGVLEAHLARARERLVAALGGDPGPEAELAG